MGEKYIPWRNWNNFCGLHKFWHYKLQLPLIRDIINFEKQYFQTFKQSFKLSSCLNVKELLAGSRREIWSLSDCNWTWTQNHLVGRWTLNDWAVFWVLICTVRLTVCSCHVMYAFQSKSTLASRVQLQSLKLQISRLLWARSSLTFRQLKSVDSLWKA